jgi:hypothetical protein
MHRLLLTLPALSAAATSLPSTAFQAVQFLAMSPGLTAGTWARLLQSQSAGFAASAPCSATSNATAAVHTCKDTST